MTIKQDHKTKSEKIEIIDTLLEDASEIVADMKGGNNKQNEEIRLLSLLFQILSLLFSIKAEYDFENSAGIISELPNEKVFTEEGADIIELNRRKSLVERRKQRTYIADDRRIGFSDRRKKKTI